MLTWQVIYKFFSDTMDELWLSGDPLVYNNDEVAHMNLKSLCANFDDYREAIINHWNGQKAYDEKHGNPYHRCDYYKWAQIELNILKRLTY